MARPVKKDAFDASPRDLGRYRLHGEIASGGMATVHFGRQVASGGFSKTVAIKCLHPQFGKMPEFVSMFLSEARLAARIRHPNVVQPLDVLTVDDELFLVMEYVEGDSLSRLMRATLARKERVPIPVAVSILCGVLHGLHAAHEAKSDRGEPLELVHRDVSPQNVLVGVDGVPRVIDFGIAKAADSVQFTRDGELKGKLSYMAPEQLNGHRCTRRSDIYAASVVLWEVLTGQRLFDADYQSAILKNILHRPVDPPSDVVAEVPKALDRIVLKGLAKDPSDRFATAREMALQLEESVPLATQSSVGAWVEFVAAKSLAARAARVAEIESVPSTALPEGSGLHSDEGVAEEIGSELFIKGASPEASAPDGRISVTPAVPSRPAPRERTPVVPSGGPPAPPASGRTTRAPSYRVPSVDPPRQSDPGPRPPPPPPASGGAATSRGTANLFTKTPERVDTALLASPLSSRPGPVSSPISSGGAPGPSTPRPPPPTINVQDGTAEAPAWPVPGIAPAPAGARLVLDPPKRSSGAGMVVLLLSIALAVAGFYFLLPEFLKRSCVSSAQRAYGVSMTIDSVALTLKRIRLLGVSATSPDVPGVSVHCKEIELGLSNISVSGITTYDLVVNVDGPYTSISEGIGRWRAAHPAATDPRDTIQHVKVDSGQIIWTRPLGDQTRLEAENVTADLDRAEGRPLGDDYQLAAPILVVNDSSGKLGPWQLAMSSDARITKAILSLDPSGASRAQMTVSIWDGVINSVELAVPRTPLAQLGVEPKILGLRSDQSVIVEGDAEYIARSAGHAEVHAKLIATGARVGGATTPSEIQAELRLAGDPSATLDLTDGFVSVAGFRARPQASAKVGPGFARGELAWVVPGRCIGDQLASVTMRLDTRNLDASSWTVGGAKCRPAP